MTLADSLSELENLVAGTTWLPGTLRHFESSISLGAKWCHLNVLRPYQFDRWMVNVGRLARIKKVSFHTLLAKMLGEPIKIIRSLDIEISLPIEIWRHDGWTYNKRRYCSACIREGYHSRIHDISWMQKCFIHETDLLDLSSGQQSYEVVALLSNIWFNVPGKFNLPGLAEWSQQKDASRSEVKGLRVIREINRLSSLVASKGLPKPWLERFDEHENCARSIDYYMDRPSYVSRLTKVSGKRSTNIRHYWFTCSDSEAQKILVDTDLIRERRIVTATWEGICTPWHRLYRRIRDDLQWACFADLEHVLADRLPDNEQEFQQDVLAFCEKTERKLPMLAALWQTVLDLGGRLSTYALQVIDGIAAWRSGQDIHWESHSEGSTVKPWVSRRWIAAGEILAEGAVAPQPVGVAALIADRLIEEDVRTAAWVFHRWGTSKDAYVFRSLSDLEEYLCSVWYSWRPQVQVLPVLGKGICLTIAGAVPTHRLNWHAASKPNGVWVETTETRARAAINALQASIRGPQQADDIDA